MNVAIINNGESYPQRIIDLLLSQVHSTAVDVAVFKWSDANNIDIRHTDLVILSGSSQMPIVYNQDVLLPEIEFIQKCELPMIGICYGCELMAIAFGGTLKDDEDNKQAKIISISVHDNSSLIFMGLDSFEAYDAHRWVIDTVPGNFSILATSERGPEVIKHNERPMYGFQFHPEKMVNQSFGDEVFLATLKTCKLIP